MFSTVGSVVAPFHLKSSCRGDPSLRLKNGYAQDDAKCLIDATMHGGVCNSSKSHSAND